MCGCRSAWASGSSPMSVTAPCMVGAIGALFRMFHPPPNGGVGREPTKELWPLFPYEHAAKLRAYPFHRSFVR